MKRIEVLKKKKKENDSLKKSRIRQQTIAGNKFLKESQENTNTQLHVKNKFLEESQERNKHLKKRNKIAQENGIRRSIENQTMGLLEIKKFRMHTNYRDKLHQKNTRNRRENLMNQR